MIRGGVQDSGSSGLEDGVERGGEVRSAVADQCSEDCAVGPVEAGPRIGPSQHGDLVSQHEQFGVLAGG
jgi:hypothetical protein